MKKICYFFFLSSIFLSCNSKNEETKYYRGWLDTDYYEFTLKNKSIIGKSYDTYHRDKPETVSGITTKDSIFWSLNTDRKDGSYYYNGFVDKKGDIQLGDSLALTLIPKKEFDSIIKEAYFSKLVNKQKVFILDDYIFDIQVKNWNYHDAMGETFVFVKDKKTKKLLQTIKSDYFVFEKDLTFSYTDVNFDGKKDLSFYIGHLGNRGADAFNFYLFNNFKKQFEYSSEISRILSPASISNSKTKTIIDFNTGSCCTHYADKYKVEGNKITKIKKMLVHDNNDIEVTTEVLKNGVWIKDVKNYPLNFKKDFYENF